MRGAGCGARGGEPGADGAVEIASHLERVIPARSVRQLYDHAGWWPRRGEGAIAAVLDAGPAVGAWEGERLVGFARAVADGPFRAYIEDVIVEGRYRGRGVGNRLVARLLRELGPIETVSLFCDPALVPWYEGHGFRPTSQIVMHRR